MTTPTLADPEVPIRASVLRWLLCEREDLRDALTRVQTRCTELEAENRAYRAKEKMP